ncbi:MAG: hypothetical protein LBQ08_05085 [Holosporaceae bacterium]|jgi:hypothetical protein|nr:hypothetical protein [Holosporaceae bacterium]
MARIRFNHSSFSTGIVSKKVQGNTDFEKYNNSLDECVNFQIQHTGGCFKRGGTYFSAVTKNNNPARLIPFSYSTDNSYVCEFTAACIRFHTRDGILKINDNIFEITNPFDWPTIEDLHYYQNANVLYLRTAIGIFSMEFNAGNATAPFTFNESPLEYTVMPLTFINSKDIYLKPEKVAGEDGKYTLTPVNSKGEAPDSKYAPLFYESDATSGDAIRDVVLNYIDDAAGGGFTSYYLRIELVSIPTSPTEFSSLTAIIDEELSPAAELPNNKPVQYWQISAFSPERGFPKAVAIYEGRQFLANNKSSPLGIWGSSLLYQDWFNFLPGSNDADAIQNITSMAYSDEILWMIGHSKLFIGAKSGIYVAGASSYNDEAMTPTNFRARLFESTGASKLQPIAAMNTVFYVDSSGRNVHEIAFGENEQYSAYDLSLLSNDLTQSGIIAHTWQQTPIKTYWCAVNDGYLCSLTYLKSNDILAWSRHEIAGKNVRVTSLATIQADRTDYVWIVVQREIGGVIKRHVEYLHPMYDPLGQEEFKQFYVDSGITKQRKYTIAKITGQSENTSKSKNARIGCIMAPFRTVAGYPSFSYACFKGDGTDTLLLSRNIFYIKNISDSGFDLLWDSRWDILPPKRKITRDFKKIDPWNYQGYETTRSEELFLLISQITGIEQADEGTFLECNKDELNRLNSNAVLIQNLDAKSKALSNFLLDDENILYSSNDGRNFTNIGFIPGNGPIKRIIQIVKNGSGVRLIVLREGMSSIHVSDDYGVHWQELSPSSDINFYDMVAGIDHLNRPTLVVLGKMRVNPTLLKSIISLDGGDQWSAPGAYFGSVGDGKILLSYRNNSFVVLYTAISADVSVTYVYNSGDGLNWSSVFTGPLAANLVDVGKSANNFIVLTNDAGQPGKILKSSQDSAWTNALIPGVTNPLTSIACKDNIWLAAGENGGIFRSVDEGNTWEKIDWVTNANFASVNYGNGYFMLVGGGDIFLTRDGAVLLSRINIPTKNFVFAVESTIIDLNFKNSGRSFKFEITGDRPNGIWLLNDDGSRLKLPYKLTVEDFNNPAEIFGNVVYDNRIITIDDISLGSNCVVNLKTALDLAVNNLDEVYINKIIGMTELNQKIFLIAHISQDRKSVVLYDIENSPEPYQNRSLAVVDSENYLEFDTTIENNGNLYLYFQTVEGLDHLAGQEVVVCADGNADALQRIIVPTDGVIRLSETTMYASVGLRMKAYLKTTPFSGGSVLGTSDGAVASQKSLTMYLYHSLGGKYGAEESPTVPIKYVQSQETIMNQAKKLYTGRIKAPLPNTKNTFDRTIYIESDDPLSFNVLSIVQDSSVSDS